MSRKPFLQPRALTLHAETWHGAFQATKWTRRILSWLAKPIRQSKTPSTSQSIHGTRFFNTKFNNRSFTSVFIPVNGTLIFDSPRHSRMVVRAEQVLSPRPMSGLFHLIPDTTFILTSTRVNLTRRNILASAWHLHGTLRTPSLRAVPNSLLGVPFASSQDG